MDEERNNAHGPCDGGRQTDTRSSRPGRSPSSSRHVALAVVATIAAGYLLGYLGVPVSWWSFGILLAIPLFVAIRWLSRALAAVRQRALSVPVKALYVVGTMGWRIAVLALLLWYAVFAHAAVARQREMGRRGRCLSNMKTIAGAIELYLDENDGTFPPAEVWCDAIEPYLPDSSSLICPEVPRLRCGCAYNAVLSGARRDEIRAPRGVVLVFESDAGWNAAGGTEMLPDIARHRSGDVYLFADGHVGWVHRMRSSELTWEPVTREPGDADTP